MTKTKVTPGKGGAVGAYNKTAPTMAQLRNKLKYSVSTTSTTASGVVPIKGATKYPTEPLIFFTREAWVKQCHLVAESPLEVGWFALVDYDEEYNSFTITELVIPCQEVTAAETDIGKEDLADAAMELIEAGKDTSKMFAWFHSHVNMGVGPSAQDEFQVEDFLEDLADQPEVPAFIRGIQNKKGDLKLDVYYIQHGVAYQNLDFSVIHDDDPAWLADIESQIKTKVTARTYHQPYGGYGGNRHTTGKSLPGNASPGNPNVRPNGRTYNWGDDGLRGDLGYGGYDSWYDDYGEITGVGTAVDDQDIPDVLTPVTPPTVSGGYKDSFGMEVVYNSGDNKEVLLDIDGVLWVCDERGDLYDYNEYTEVYGGMLESPRVTPPAILY